MAPKALTPAQVIAGEAVSGTVNERFDDMVAIASVVANRARQLSTTPEDVVSVQKQFNAYGQPLDKGRAAYVGLAQAAIDKVAAEGPIHTGTFYATPAAFNKIGVKGLSQVAQTKGHIYAEDPKGRAIQTASGFKTPKAAADEQVAANAPIPSARPALSGLAGVAPSLTSYAPAAPAPRSALAAIAAAAPAASLSSLAKQGPLSRAAAPAAVQTGSPAPSVNPLGFTSSPIAAETRVTSSFSNARKNPVDGRMRPHTGIDMAGMAPGAVNGKSMLAVRDGTVLSAGKVKGYGNQVVVDHGFGLTTSYNHMKSIDVKAGDPVKAAQTIGAVGSTGRSTGPHLHFEARINGKPVNPETAVAALGRVENAAVPAPEARDPVAAAKAAARNAMTATKVAPPSVATPSPAVARNVAPIQAVAVEAARPKSAPVAAAKVQAATPAATVASRTPAKQAPADRSVVGVDATPGAAPSAVAAGKTARLSAPAPQVDAARFGPELSPKTPAMARPAAASPAVSAATALASARVLGTPTPTPSVAPTVARAVTPMSVASVPASPVAAVSAAVKAAPVSASPVARVAPTPVAAVSPTVSKAIAPDKTIIGVDATPSVKAPVPSYSALMAESQAKRAKAVAAAPVAAPALPAPKTVEARRVAGVPAVAAAAPAPRTSVRSAAPATSRVASESPTRLGQPATPDAPGFAAQAVSRIGHALSENKGKMIGSVLGSLVGGPLGALAGGFIGNKVQKSGQPQMSATARDAMANGGFDGFGYGAPRGSILGGLFSSSKPTGLGAPSVPNAPTGQRNYSTGSGGGTMSSAAKSAMDSGSFDGFSHDGGGNKNTSKSSSSKSSSSSGKKK